jgi:hypothetical protein
MLEINTGPIDKGQRVYSDFEVIQGFPVSPESFDYPHTLIAASFNSSRIFPNKEYARIGQSLMIPNLAIWQPGSRIGGARHIAKIVRKGIDLHLASTKIELARGERQHAWGEVTCFDYLDHGDEGENRFVMPDHLPHSDYAPPEIYSSVLFASNLGGTVLYRGHYDYIDNTQESYLGQVIKNKMDKYKLEPGEFVFGDYRTLLHNRDPETPNVGRVLIRVFFGE